MLFTGTFDGIDQHARDMAPVSDRFGSCWS
jgi:hypothetical protein